jgi:flavorubredoxin
MKSQKLYSEGHQWYLFGRDSSKPDLIIDTNQYLIVNGDEAVLLDPGGVELFSPMLAAIMKYIDIDHLKYLFASHQDPDIISSLGMWDQILPNATLYSPWLWEGFIRHFGMEKIAFKPIKDEGGQLLLGNLSLEFIPAHYLHSSGNFHVYDPKAKILFSGDVGAALESVDAPLFVDDFNDHIDKMKGFHQRWMPSNQAKQDWINRVRKLDIDMMVPQHGRIFKGKHVKDFLDWFEVLDVGTAIS